MCLIPLPVAGPLLTLWLGSEFEGLAVLIFVLLLSRITVVMGSTAQPVLMGLGKLKFLGSVTFASGALGLLSAWFYVELIAPSLVGAAICLYFIQAVGGLIIFLYGSSVTGSPWLSALVHAAGRPVLLGIFGGAITWAIMFFFGDNALWKLVVSLCAGELSFLALVFTIALTVEEKSRLYSFFSAIKVRLGHVLYGASESSHD
ncbi:hypothetical protein ES703_119257 [subsurface metagenome]